MCPLPSDCLVGFRTIVVEPTLTVALVEAELRPWRELRVVELSELQSFGWDGDAVSPLPSDCDIGVAIVAPSSSLISFHSVFVGVKMAGSLVNP